MAAALPTFRESTVGGIGMAAASSQAASAAGERPWPSLPKTRQQSPARLVWERVRPSVWGWAARQRMPCWRKAWRSRARLEVSTMGRWKMAPIELRTARRRKGLAQVSPTSRAWAAKAAQLRTRAPRFSALERPSAAASKRGGGLRARMSTSVGWGGTFPTASRPWYMEKPVSVSSSFFSATKTWMSSRRARRRGSNSRSHFSGSSTEMTGNWLSSSRRTTFSPSATKMPCCRCSTWRRMVR